MAPFSCQECGTPLQATSSDQTLLRCPGCAPLSSPEDPSFLSFSIGGSTSARPQACLPLPPELRQRYRMKQLLGQGAMGMVMLAHGVTDGLPVAVKFLMQMNDAEMLNRFLREGQLLSRIHHPNVLELFDFGQIDGHPYLVMEYLSGGTLRGRLKDRGRLGVEESVKVALDCLAGLAACHAQGVVHRDLKPENVLFSEDGRAKLADLGMARSYSNATLLTQAGVVIGTPMYMSPEQVRGEPAGAAADIYALGLMMFEMLSGRHVIRGTTMSAVLRAHVDGHTDRLDDLVPELPPSLVKAVHLAMSKEISVRPPTAEDFARRLESSLKGPRKAGRPAQQPEGRRVILVALAIALTVVAAIAAPMLSRHRDLASRPPRAAGPSAETLAVPTAGAGCALQYA